MPTLLITLFTLKMQGNSIHAQIYPPAIDSLRPLLKEQKVYYIDSFTVRYANRTYRPVDNSLMIVFSKWTTFEEYIEPAADFPGITFSLTPFSDIPNLVDKTIFYVGNEILLHSYICCINNPYYLIIN